MSMSEGKKSCKKLELNEVLADFINLELIDQFQARSIREQTVNFEDMHPLIVIEGCQIADRRGGKKEFDLEELTQWLAQYSGHEYFFIDLLKLNINHLDDFVSEDVLLRHEIIPIDVEGETIIIATSQPFDLSWIDEINLDHKKNIIVKVANPKMILHCLEEFISSKSASA